MTTFKEVAAQDLADLRRRQGQIENRRLDIAAAPADPLDLAEVRDRFDPVYRQLGAGGAPSPLSYESPFSYRRRLAAKISHLSPTWRDANVHDLDRDVMDNVERQIIAEARAAVADHSRGTRTDRSARSTGATMATPSPISPAVR